MSKSLVETSPTRLDAVMAALATLLNRRVLCVSETAIRSVESTPLRFPLPKPISSALGAYTHVDATVVRLDTEGRLTGFGVSAGLGGSASAAMVPYIEAELAPLTVGQVALAPEALWHRLWRANKPRMRAGLGVWALSALNIACWDLVGKAADLPLHRLLGGSVSEAIEASRMLADHGVEWPEEPVLADSIADLAAVARASAVPVAAGENVYFRWGFREICDQRAATYLQPDVGRVGGITEFVKVAHLADAHNLYLSSHLWHELSISLIGASASGFMAEYAESVPSDTLTHPFEVVAGHIQLPDVPGHGVEITQAALSRFGL